MSRTENRNVFDLGALIDEFVDQCRSGQAPSIDEYAERYPELAGEIRDIFPTLALVEDVASEQDDEKITADGAVLKTLGDFRILREIGRGGMGIVYEAMQESLGRHVAIKVLPYHCLLDPKQLQRFRTEARAAAQLHHSNIVPVFGVGEYDGVHYYAMQHIRGQSLDNVLKELRLIRSHWNQSPASPFGVNVGGDSNECPSVASYLNQPSSTDERSRATVLLPDSASRTGESGRIRIGHAADANQGKSSSATLGDAQYFRSVANIGVQVADALAYAHHQGVLHRDVKPSNLLLDSSGTVWLTDFGLAKTDEENLTRSGDFVGTLRYMAPERFEGTCDHRSDIYSLGLTLYELLALRPAFEQQGRVELVKSVTQEVPRPLRRIDRNIPRNLETIILKSTARDPSSRYLNAARMAEDLRQFLADRPIEARRTPAAERVWLWCRRNRLSALLISAVATLLVASTVGSMLYSRQLKKNLDRAITAESLHKQAENQATRRLFDAYLTQARAVRLSRRPGRRIDAIEAISRAAALQDRLELSDRDRLVMRNEAIASLAHIDLRLDRHWSTNDYRIRSAHARWAIDSQVRHYACELATGELSVRRVDDNVEERRLAGIEPADPERSRPYLLFSPNDRYLAEYGVFSGGRPRVQLFDVSSGEAMFPAPRESQLFSYHSPIDFTADSQKFGFVDLKQQLCIVDLSSRREVTFPLRERPAFLSFSPDGSKVAVEERGTDILLVDTDVGEPSERFVHPDYISRVDWSPDGQRIAAPCANHQVYVWNTDDTEKPQVVCRGHTGAVKRVAFNSGGLLLSSGWDQTTRIWDAGNGQELMRLDSPGGTRFSQDDQWLGFEYAGHSVDRYEVIGGQECRVLSGSANNRVSVIRDLSFSPDGQWLVSASGTNGYRIHHVHDGQRVVEFAPYAESTSVTFSRDGKSIIASGVSAVDQWKFESNESSGLPGLSQMDSLYKPVDRQNIAISLAKNGRLAIAEIQSGKLSVLAEDRSTRLCQLNDHAWANHVSISPNGKSIACGSWHADHWTVWEVESGTILAQGKIANSAIAVQFSPDGNWFVVRAADQVQFLRTSDWELDAVIDREQPGYANVAFSPDHNMVAITEMYHTKLYDLATQRLLAEFRGPRDGQLSTSHPNAAAIAFSPDGRFLAIGTYEDTIALWDLQLVRSRLADLGLDL